VPAENHGQSDCGVEIFAFGYMSRSRLIMSDEKNEDVVVPKLGVRSSLIKNKLRRQMFYQKERLRKAKEKRNRKECRKRQAEEQAELGKDVSSLSLCAVCLHAFLLIYAF